MDPRHRRPRARSTSARPTAGWRSSSPAPPTRPAQFLGPWADKVLTFADPDRAVVRGLALNELPAFVHIRGDRTVAAAAEGWDPEEWRKVAESLAENNSWSTPLIPDERRPLALRRLRRRGADRAAASRQPQQVEDLVDLVLGDEALLDHERADALARSSADSFTSSATRS